MSVFRSYFSANNTIISKSFANTGRNEVMELAYGNTLIPSGTGDTIYTRYLFRPDLANLQQAISDSLVGNIQGHRLRMYNTLILDKKLIEKKAYDNSKRGYGFTLNLYRLDEPFVEGTGHDFIYPNTFTPTVSLTDIERNDNASNWYFRTINDLWTNEGAISHTGSTLIGSQYFEFGTEDVDIDMSSEISLLLAGSIPNNGYCIAFIPDFELFQDSRLNKVHFFSKYTQTFFEPFIETVFDDIVVDNGGIPDSIILDQSNNLYIESPCLITGGTLYDHCGNQVFVATGATQVQDGVYMIQLPPISSALYPSKVNFEFQYQCNNKNCYIQATTFDSESCRKAENKILYNNDFDAKLNNLKQGENIKRGLIRKVYVDVSNINQLKGYVPLEFRIYTLQNDTQIEVQPYQRVNRLQGQHYFYLYTSWMIPKEYYIEIIVKDDKYEYSSGFKFRFFIVDEKNNGFR